MKKRINLAVVDDQQLFRKGMISLIEEFNEIRVVIEASNGKELLEKMKECDQMVDVILLDIEMPVMDGIETTIKLKQKYPLTKIVILTMHDEEEMIVHLIEKGAHGFLPKNEDLEKVIDAIFAVNETGYYFNDKVSRAMVTGLLQNNKITPQFLNTELNDKELEILVMICKEFSSQEIADLLDLSIKTVNNYRTDIIKKIGARSTVGLVMYAVKKGLID